MMRGGLVRSGYAAATIVQQKLAQKLSNRVR